jgi:threonine/homoserine/homoserine lactone efflux protein
MYITTRSASQGPRAGFVSVLGVHAGTLVHVVASAIGVSAVLAASAVAFSAVKGVGGMYLIYLGVRALLRKEDVAELPAPQQPRPHKRLFVDGAVVNLLNPKTALFFLAFLPQFIAPSRGPVWMQTMTLGLLFVGIGLVSDSAYALIGARIGVRLRSSRRRLRATRVVEGGTMIALGVAALATPHRRAAA